MTIERRHFATLCILLAGLFCATTSKSQTADKQLRLSDKILPLGDENVFRDSVYYNWCNSIIKGKDGKYHLFYSRWKRAKSFTGWLVFSQVAHAVSEKPAGPYRYVNTVLDFGKANHKAGEMIMAHNPKVKYFNGRYYLYFISTHSDKDIAAATLDSIASTGYPHPLWIPLRENQRTYVASSANLDKGWKIRKKPLVEPSGPIKTLAVNPAVTQGPDGKFYLIVKGDRPGTNQFLRNQAVAVSNHPDRGFVIQPKPVIDDIDTEDVSLWYDMPTRRFYSIFHAHTFLGMMTSKDGINWEKAADFEVMKKRITRPDGRPDLVPDRLERPSVFSENSVPEVLSAAVKTGDDAYIITIPLKSRNLFLNEGRKIHEKIYLEKGKENSINK